VIKAGLVLVVAVSLLSLQAYNTVPVEPVVASPPPADMARLYIYRDATICGSQLWRAVSLNGQVMGSSEPGAVFYRDVAPGTYEVEVASDKLYPDQFKMVRLVPGSITFVKIQEQPSWSQSGFGTKGVTFVVAIIEPAIGTAEMRAESRATAATRSSFAYATLSARPSEPHCSQRLGPSRFRGYARQPGVPMSQFG
jgi:hypothetical protein